MPKMSVNSILTKVYERNNIFADLADNSLLGCSRVVGVNSQKWGLYETGWLDDKKH